MSYSDKNKKKEDESDDEDNRKNRATEEDLIKTLGEIYTVEDIEDRAKLSRFEAHFKAYCEKEKEIHITRKSRFEATNKLYEEINNMKSAELSDEENKKLKELLEVHTQNEHILYKEYCSRYSKLKPFYFP